MNNEKKSDAEFLQTPTVLMGSGEVPMWWKLIALAIVLCAFPYFAYYHFGTPGRTAVDSFEVALARNTELQFAEIGELKQDEATMVKFLNQPSWLSVGQSVFKTHCVQCHGAMGEGKIGPNLADESFKHIRGLEDILAVINRGAAGNSMPAWQSKLNTNEIVLVSTYVASLRGSNPPGGKGAEGQVIPPWPVDASGALPQASDPNSNSVSGSNTQP